MSRFQKRQDQEGQKYPTSKILNKYGNEVWHMRERENGW